MRNETESAGLRATLLGAAVLALAVTLAGGCGGDDPVDPPINPQPDAGNNPPPDAGVPDAGVAPSADTEFAAVRFNPDGTRDTTFGTDGVAKVNLGTGTAANREALWGLSRDSSDRLVLFGHAKGEGDRVDT